MIRPREFARKNIYIYLISSYQQRTFTINLSFSENVRSETWSNSMFAATEDCHYYELVILLS